MDGTVLPGEAYWQSSLFYFRAVDFTGLFSARRSVRKLDGPGRGDSHCAHGAGGNRHRSSGPAFSQRLVHADRSRVDDRSGRQERDSDRGVRSGAQGGGNVSGGCRCGSDATALSADPDDFHRVHFGRRASLDRYRRRLRQPTIPRHRGVWRHDRFYIAGDTLRAGLLHNDAASKRTARQPPEVGQTKTFGSVIDTRITIMLKKAFFERLASWLDDYLGFVN